MAFQLEIQMGDIGCVMKILVVKLKWLFSTLA